jgi:uncharacterized phosphatase
VSAEFASGAVVRQQQEGANHRAQVDRRPFCYLRHGETEANLQQVFAGRLETPLTSLGLAQAASAAEALFRAKERWSGIWCSPLDRAVRTAEVIARRLGVSLVVVEELIERDFGDLEGTPYTTIDRLSGPGLEEESALIERASTALGKVFAQSPLGVPIVVSHGAFFRGVAQVLGLAGVSALPIPNGRPAFVRPEGDCWHLTVPDWDCTGHPLP